MDIRIDSSMLDAYGKVMIWLKEEKKWAKRYPVDAKEMIRGNVASLHSPEGANYDGKIAERIDAFDFTKYNLDELRELCVASKINFNGLTSERMVEALRIAKVDPRKDTKEQAEATVANISSSITGRSSVRAGG